MLSTHVSVRRSFTRVAMAACAALVASACTVSKQEGPELSGPSGFALNVNVSATPDVLPADGASVSLVKVSVRDADGKPKSGQRLALSATNGVLSQSEVTTSASGDASVQFTAPPTSVSSSSVKIFATPIATNTDNTVSQFVSISLTGVVVPSASFTVSSSTPGLNDQVNFDASGTKINGSTCGTQCTYAWDFGDGNSSSGLTTSHRFGTRGTYVVHLAVTSPTGSIAGTNSSLTVGNPSALTPDIKISPTNPKINIDSVQFDGSGSTTPDGTTIVSYVWDFGDGNGATGKIVTHVFGVARTYTIRLTITDSLGRTATTTTTLAPTT